MTNTIFHYTSVDSFLGMMASTSADCPYFTFWATEASYMNDPEEKKIGLQVLNTLYEEVENRLNIPAHQRFSTFRERLSNDASCLFASIAHHVYLVSFSEEGDSLPMWEMYAKRGNGVNLGFDTNSVISYEKRNLASLSRALYRPDNIDRIIERLKMIYSETQKEVCDTYSCLLATGKKIKLDEDEFIVGMIRYVMEEKTSWWFKHEAYEYEREIRLAIPEVYHVSFRVKEGFVVPYIELKIPVDALTSITFGPTADMDRLSIPIRQLLRSKGLNLDGIQFLNSKVPYRL